VSFESGRRLCLLFEAGQTHFAIDATSVLEVATPDLSDKRIRGTLELRDLTELFGAPAEVRPGMGLVLDVSPTLAVRIRRVVEVVDVSRDPFFHLPPALGELLSLVVRGALLHADTLYLELIPEALPRASNPRLAPPGRPIYLCEQPPERALVVESQGKLFGIPLPFVSQIIPSARASCPLPAPGGPVAGLEAHGQALWPVYSVPALLGNPATAEKLSVLTELAGQNVALCAQRALGVHAGFVAESAHGEYRAKGLPTPVLFLDFQRMFS
jgi:chemotaxis signal transduction protein